MTTWWRLAAVGFLCASLGAPAAAGEPVANRPLADVLREFQDEGLELVYTSAVVSGDLVVTIEPTAASPRARLEQILAPLGLSLVDGPGDSLVIVPATENPGVIRGRVVSAEGRHRVPLAVVSLTEPALSTETDRNGLFELSPVPHGNRVLEVRAPGFRPTVVECPTLQPGGSTFVLVALPFESSFVTEVVVTPGRHIVEREEPPAQRSVSREEALAAPSTSGDATRVVEFLPGVAAPDNSAGFRIRGGDRRDTSIVLDGLELYDPFHLDQFQSPFSLVDSNAVERIDVRAGGFTADLGDRHGGFVEITTLVPDERSGALEIGTVNSRFTYQTPLAGRAGSLLVSGRAWYPDQFFDSTELGGSENIQPDLQDLYAKATFGVSPKFAWSAHLLAGHDGLAFQETDEDVNESADADTGNVNLWVRGLGRIGENVRTETTVSLGSIDKKRSGISAPDDEPLLLRDNRDVRYVGLRHDMTWRGGERHWLKGGVDARRLQAKYDYSIGPMDDPAAARTTRLEPDGVSIGAYAAYRRAFSTRAAAELGIRWDRQTYTGDNQISPRFNATWRPNERGELRFAAGRYQQSQRIHELSVEDGETAFGSAEASEQAELSYELTVGSGVRVRVDTYYRKLSSLRPRYENLFEPVEIFPETTEDRIAIRPDGAVLRGLEVFLRSPASAPLHWWASYTYSRAEDEINGYDVPRAWDQPHAVKFLLGYRTPGHWSVALSGVYRTGWPTTPVSGEIVDDMGSLEEELIVGPRNTERLREYVRFDVRARRGFVTSRGHRVWISLDVANLTDRRNPSGVADFFFDSGPPGPVDVAIEYDSWLGFRPSFSVLWEF